MRREDSVDLSRFEGSRKLEEFLADKRRGDEDGSATFETFEVELARHMRELESEIKAEELSRYDVEAHRIVVDGREWRKCLEKEGKRYLTSSGPVVVKRNLFRAADGSGKSICPLELRAGIVGERASPLLARQVSFCVGHMTPKDTEQLFRELQIDGPSKSTCDRLPKLVSQNWEKHREVWEEALRNQETVPAEASVVAVSLDGVMVPDKAGQQEAKAKREEAQQEGKAKQPTGPRGYREVGCGTVTIYNSQGERLQTVRYAREPEYKKQTLTEQLDAEVGAILSVQPDLRLVSLADGAEENWRYFAGSRWNDATKIVDFGHGSGHLKNGLNAYYGKDTVEGRAEYERLKLILRDKPKGVDKVIKKLKRLERKLPGTASATRRKNLRTERQYFENQEDRMDYARYQELGLPIGSGIVEAACKTLATQRMKQSGMSWGCGKQAILSIRSLVQSDRWSRAWDFLAASFRKPVYTVERHGPFKAYEPAPLAAAS